ncbi:MAG: hypothetical protein U0574_06085 [Phycisphaerales bacterium]
MPTPPPALPASQLLQAAPAAGLLSTGWPLIDLTLGGGLRLDGIHEWFAIGDGPAARVPPLAVLTRLAWQAIRAEPWGAAASASSSSATASHPPPDSARWVVWIGSACRPHARLLVAGLRGMHGGRRCRPDLRLLERSLAVDARTPAERLWATEQAARCPGVCAVIADAAGMDMAASRRLQLAATGGSLVLLARPERERHLLSAASTRWLVEPHTSPDAPPEVSATIRPDTLPSWRLTLLRARHVQPHAAAAVAEGRVQVTCSLEMEAGPADAVLVEEVAMRHGRCGAEPQAVRAVQPMRRLA